MSRRITNRMAALSVGMILLTSASGCFYIPAWRFPDPPPCQAAEDAWGCSVDCICNHSLIDRPWCDPHYVKQGVYRVDPPYGIGSYWPEGGDQGLYGMEDRAPDMGDLKPPTFGDPGPELHVPE